MIRTIRTFPLALGLLLAFARVACAADEAAAQASFDVLEYRVLGNTVLPQKDVEAAVYPHLGPGKRMDDVQQARAALGTYPYTSELTFTQRTGLATSNVNGQRLAAILTTRGQTAASMPNNASTFAIPFAVGTNLPVLPLSSTAPVALGTRNKNSCIPAGLTN